MIWRLAGAFFNEIENGIEGIIFDEIVVSTYGVSSDKIFDVIEDEITISSSMTLKIIFSV